MKRRQFLINSILLSTSALAGFGCAARQSGGASPVHRSTKQEYYELRAYRMKPGIKAQLLLDYLENAAIPAYNRVGSWPVGVFTEVEPKDPETVFVLVPHPSLDAFGALQSRLDRDATYQQAAASYLEVAKTNAVYDRIDIWVMRAFAGMPRIELADFSRERRARLFEMRTYESYSEQKARKKVAMFNDGEIQVMREVGLAPVFYGEALSGPNLPHLTYMTSAANEAVHKQHWEAFGKHPKWNEMKNDPQYADTVSRATKWFLVPVAGSQI